LFNHKDDHLLTRQSSGTLKLSVDEKGLKYEFASPNTQMGNDILEMMERGDLSQSSFAFTIEKETWEYEEVNGETERRRIINKIDLLYDVSPVTYPAYSDTTVAKRSWERFEKEGQERVKNMTNEISEGLGGDIMRADEEIIESGEEKPTAMDTRTLSAIITEMELSQG
jgi:HK97 family phage prohead protease